jgi:hypothetical protein|tara:strand:+ start:7669 stop:7941 length:273 start_codon:yes stop_codon:yes gene_type:complete
MATFEKQPGLEAAHPNTNLAVDEKATVVASDVSSSQISTPGDYDGELPDPDVGKTDEERARLVRPLAHRFHPALLMPHRTKPSSGRWIYG